MKALFLFLILSSLLFSQKDKGEFRKNDNQFYQEIIQELDKTDSIAISGKKFKLDFSNYYLPTTLEQFDIVWHTKPVSQGRTGTCWSYATVSLLESEVKLITGLEADLSQMYIVYYEYLNKAESFIKSKGKTRFSEGSLSGAVIKVIKQYGIVPEEQYPAFTRGSAFPDHEEMFSKMENFLNSLNEQDFNNVELNLNIIKTILRYYLGEPPTTVVFEGNQYSPLEFSKKVLKINPDDYVAITSMLNGNFFTKITLNVPDNWWNSNNYYNVPLDVFMETMGEIISKGYSFVIDGDVSESGIDGIHESAVVPDFDIPSDFINSYSRQFRFENGSTSDDHLIHVVGESKLDDEKWYLIKDSGSHAFNGKNKGYLFYHSDYIKLKMLFFFVNKNAVRNILEKFDGVN